jgi:hypothetical protein
MGVALLNFLGVHRTLYKANKTTSIERKKQIDTSGSLWKENHTMFLRWLIVHILSRTYVDVANNEHGRHSGYL